MDRGSAPDQKSASAEANTSLARWFGAVRAWWWERQWLALLGSESDKAWEAAIAYFLAQGAAARPRLWAALHGSMQQACGAATVLARMGDGIGIATVLARCYEEEWILRCVRDGYSEGLHALRRLEREDVGRALLTALTKATKEYDASACLHHLVIALGALRVLVIFEGTSPILWYERALCFGPQSLHGLREQDSGVWARSLTYHIRAMALRGLLAEQGTASLELLLSALACEDMAVVRTAILGLRRLGDRRSLPALQALAFGKNHPLASRARAAVQTIAGAQSEALTLLRASETDAPPEELLRSLTATRAEIEAERTLVRSM